jgi:MFS family permease
VNAPVASRSTRRIVYSLGLLSALLAAGYGVMFTVLDDFRDDYGISEAALGVVVGVGFFTSFLAQVLIAPLADRGHARRLVLIGLVANIVGLVCMAYGTRLWVILLGRIVMGLGAGTATPAVRRIAILADPDNLGQNLGRLLAADVCGFASGPAVSAIFAPSLGLPAPFLIIAGATALCIPLVGRIGVEDRAEPGQERFAFDLLSSRPFVSAVLLGCAVFLMIGTFDTLWVITLRDLGAADWIGSVGITLFAVPLIALGPLGGRACQRLGPFRVGTVGLAVAAVFVVLYGHLPTGGLMLAVGIVHGVTDGLTVSSSGVAVGMVVPTARQAGAQGLLGGAQTLVAGLTALGAGVLYQLGGRALAFGCCAGAMAALTMGAAWLAGPAFRQTVWTEPTPTATSTR